MHWTRDKLRHAKHTKLATNKTHAVASWSMLRRRLKRSRPTCHRAALL